MRAGAERPWLTLSLLVVTSSLVAVTQPGPAPSSNEVHGPRGQRASSSGATEPATSSSSTSGAMKPSSSQAAASPSSTRLTQSSVSLSLFKISSSLSKSQSSPGLVAVSISERTSSLADKSSALSLVKSSSSVESSSSLVKSSSSSQDQQQLIQRIQRRIKEQNNHHQQQQRQRHHCDPHQVHHQVRPLLRVRREALAGVGQWTRPNNHHHQHHQQHQQQQHKQQHQQHRHQQQHAQQQQHGYHHQQAHHHQQHHQHNHHQPPQQPHHHQQEPCGLHQVVVSVSDLELGYVSQEEFLFGYCAGSCHERRTTYDVVLGNLLRAGAVAAPAHAAPCCRPTAYAPQGFFTDDNGPGFVMHAKSCACVGGLAAAAPADEGAGKGGRAPGDESSASEEDEDR